MLLWRRGSNVLTARDLMVTRDDRVKLMNGYNLEISDLEPQDAGDYVCQISDKVNKDQVHTVEILGKFCIFKYVFTHVNSENCDYLVGNLKYLTFACCYTQIKYLKLAPDKK